MLHSAYHCRANVNTLSNYVFVMAITYLVNIREMELPFTTGVVERFGRFPSASQGNSLVMGK